MSIKVMRMMTTVTHSFKVSRFKGLMSEDDLGKFSINMIDVFVIGLMKKLRINPCSVI
jgi:hypothetical protein